MTVIANQSNKWSAKVPPTNCDMQCDFYREAQHEDAPVYVDPSSWIWLDQRDAKMMADKVACRCCGAVRGVLCTFDGGSMRDRDVCQKRYDDYRIAK